MRAFPPDKEQKAIAASTIQQNWRKRRAVAKQERYQRENEAAVVGIQSALKAHLVRKRMLALQSEPPPLDTAVGSSDEMESDSSEAVELIQSAIRGYFTRRMALRDFKQAE